jgi:hypothetical protein
MYSTLISDEEYDPLLVVYLTTTGAMLQDHVKAQLIKTALKRVVAAMGNTYVPFDTTSVIRTNLETKRQQSNDLRTEQAKAAKEVAALNAVPGVQAAPTAPPIGQLLTATTAPVLPPLPPAPPGIPGALPGYIPEPPGRPAGSTPWDPYRSVRGDPRVTVANGYPPP